MFIAAKQADYTHFGLDYVRSIVCEIGASVLGWTELLLILNFRTRGCTLSIYVETKATAYRGLLFGWNE
jgi:hypothetical protein